MTTFHFVRSSSNVKLGFIPATSTSKDSCPPTCSFKGNGCYAESGPISINWKRVSDGTRGGTLDELCSHIRDLPRGQLYRHNQAGDLKPLGPGRIDTKALQQLVDANKGRKGFTYTHYLPTPSNAKAIKAANDDGFTINLSAETLAQADEYAALGIAPVVVPLPIGTDRPLRTPGGG